MSDDLKRVYANYVNVHGSPFDVALDFGSRVGDETPSQDVRVTMSWQHFKLMVAVLNRQVETYEQTFGEIHDFASDEIEPEGVEQ